MEDSCEYNGISSSGQQRRGRPPAWELGVGLTASHLKKISLLRNVTKGLGLGRIFLVDLREMRWGGMDEIDLAHDRGQWRALVNTVRNFRLP
jgi:hypothetical protein